MKLWTSPQSPYARKVRIVLREKGISVRELNPNDQAIELATKNPLSKVPTLELDDGTLLYDSVVIVEYLEGLQPDPQMIPSGLYERTEVRRWEALADGIADAVVIGMLEGRRAESKRDSSVVERQHAKVRAALGVVEERLARFGALVGSTFTLADAATLSALGYCQLRAPGLFGAEYPTLQDYQLHHAGRASVSTTAPDQPLVD
jgi:glutathione S-transferase